jgi:putative drug exporter of the RND superfamily
MTAITRWVLAHKRIVVAFWVIVTLVGGGVSGPASKALKQKFSVPGKEGWQTNQEIAKLYRGTGDNSAPMMPVVKLPAGTTAQAAKPDLLALEHKMAQVLPGARVAGYGSTGNQSFLSGDGHTAFAIAYPLPDPDQPFGDNPDAEKKLDKALKGFTVAGAPVRLSGFDALNQQSGDSDGPGVLLEALVGGFGALLILAFVFGSFLAFIPLVMAIVSILTTFLLVYGLVQITDVSPIVQFLVALIGLGVAIDYALLVVVRWREETAHGRHGDEAVVRAMATAGRAVVFSGTTVAIGLLALVALPLPFLRSVGYGGMLIPLVSVAVGITLLPVVLSSWGAKLDWPRRVREDTANRSWTRWANLVVRHRVVATLAAAAVLVALLISASGLQLGLSNPDTIAKGGSAKEGLTQLERSGIGSGALLPHEVLVSGQDPAQVADRLGKVPDVHGAVAPHDAAWNRGGTSIVEVFQRPDGGSGHGKDVLDDVRSTAHSFGEGVRVGGIPAQNADFIDAVYGNFPLMIALIAVIVFVLLARAFRSLVLPAKAVVLNVVSVLAAWGVLTIIWQHGHGSDAIWGIPATGSITAWIPLMVFAFLFGLSMDYEVFILARMREEYDATGETNEAVIRGIGRTGRLVTSAALILFLAFLSLGSSPGTDVKVMATGLAAGILLDATVIRALLVPALVSLFGRWNWWLPAGPARLLRVQPSEGT